MLNLQVVEQLANLTLLFIYSSIWLCIHFSLERLSCSGALNVDSKVVLQRSTLVVTLTCYGTL